MKPNGHDASADKGLTAVQASFADAQYQCIEARDAAILMMRGAHREMEIPDAVIMEAYGMVTRGHKCEIRFKTDEGRGYIANIESFEDLIKFMQGELEATLLEAP